MKLMVNLNVRLDESEHQKLVQTCTVRGCDKSTIVREAVRAYLDRTEVSGPATESRSIPQAFNVRITSSKEESATSKAKSEAFDILEASGCINRYRANGELMFHFMPVEKENGIQYYRDTLGDKSWKWFLDEKHGWVAVARVRQG